MKPSFKAMKYQSKSHFSSGTGQRPQFRRHIRGRKNIDGSKSGFNYLQDNGNIIIEKY